MKTTNRSAIRCSLFLAVLALSVGGCGTPPGNAVNPEGQGSAVKTRVYDVRPLLNYLRRHLDHNADRQDWMGDLDLSCYDPNAAGEALVHILQRELGKGTGTEKPLVVAGLMNGQLIVRQTDMVHAHLLAFLERAGKSARMAVAVYTRYAVVAPKVADGLGVQWHQGTDEEDGDSRVKRGTLRNKGVSAVANELTRRPLRVSWSLLDDNQVDALLQRSQENPDSRWSSYPRITLHPGQPGWLAEGSLPLLDLRASLAEGNGVRLAAEVSTDEPRRAYSGGYVAAISPAGESQPATRPTTRAYEARIAAVLAGGQTLAVRLADPVWTRWQTAENGLELIVLIKPQPVLQEPMEVLGFEAPRFELTLPARP